MYLFYSTFQSQARSTSLNFQMLCTLMSTMVAITFTLAVAAHPIAQRSVNEIKMKLMSSWCSVCLQKKSWMFSQDAESENKKKERREKKKEKKVGWGWKFVKGLKKKHTEKKESWKKSKRMKFEIEFLGVRPRKLSKLFNWLHFLPPPFPFILDSFSSDSGSKCEILLSSRATQRNESKIMSS